MSVSMNVIRDTRVSSVMPTAAVCPNCWGYSQFENNGVAPVVQDSAACPNCWGHSQWENQDCRQEFKIDKGSKSEVFSRNGFIRRFVKRWL